MTLGKSVGEETLYCTCIQYKFDLSLVNPFIYSCRGESRFTCLFMHFYLYLGIIHAIHFNETSALGRFGEKGSGGDAPADVQDIFGYALHLAQAGGKHSQAKPLRGCGGAGVLEVVEDHHGDTYRAVYTVRYAMAVYVLHCFQKKSASGIATPKPDTALIQARLKAVAALEKG